MAPPRRRSSRLHGGNAIPKLKSYAASDLGSLAERGETPTRGVQSNINPLLSSPLPPQTPATAPRLKPSLQNMHPSKAHQSTTKKPDSGLQLGFTDIKPKKSDEQSSGMTQQTPSKMGISSPTFGFRFAPPGAQLGLSPQRMMGELREEALRNRAKLAAEEQKRQDGENDVTNRKIAQPKGKAGRYSEVHMAQFKKMDSIAGHPSSYRSQLNRSASSATSLKPSLKRTQSKAKLDDREDSSSKSVRGSENENCAERLENTAPAKRARKNIADDTSAARPISRGGIPAPTTPNRSHTSSKFLAAITTPTQASLSRAASAKCSSTQIPTLSSKSPSGPNLNSGTSQHMTKSAITNNMSKLPVSQSKSFLRSPGKFDRVRTMLRRVSPIHKKQPAMQTSIPSLANSPSKPTFEKTLPALPAVPTTPIGGANSFKTSKHVSFTPDTMNKNASNISTTPSPLKSGIPRSISKINFGPKEPQPAAAKPGDRVQYPSLAVNSNNVQDSQDVSYPSLSGVGPLPETPHTVPHPPPSVPGTFTFRSDHTINFGASPKGFGSSPGQASVRQVRQSLYPPPMPGSFPSTNKENSDPLLAVPHGLSNKKRRRADSDGERENEINRSLKKHKSEVAEGAMLMAPRLLQATPRSTLPGPAKKPVLSMSRLNALARPKVRK